EHFDPTLYGMAADYDEQGNYKYPEGFDPETNEWLEGYEAQREEWERQYAEAHARWEAHKSQIEDAVAADTETSTAAPAGQQQQQQQQQQQPAAPASEPEEDPGTLASDEALQALREKLTGN
ncbi:MAG TPA: 30S ribosomal protein S1, partial [Jiangellaceae bacterium]|nr:30S ribosomal protein S1 [Jiangellaceae bacterium]